MSITRPASGALIGVPVGAAMSMPLCGLRGLPLNNSANQVSVMPTAIQRDIMLARRTVKSKELAEHVGITEANTSPLQSGKVKINIKGVRFDTLGKIGDYLRCQSGALLVYEVGGESERGG